MQILDFITMPSLSIPCIFSIGMFDGVHRGHQYLLQQAKKVAVEKPLAVFTFHQATSLIPLDKKRSKLEGEGVDILIECDLTPEIKNLSPESFLSILEEKCPIDMWVVGSDVSFGKNREGDRYFLEKQGVKAILLERITYEGVDVSSTRIREYLRQGLYNEADALLGYPLKGEIYETTYDTNMPICSCR